MINLLSNLDNAYLFLSVGFFLMFLELCLPAFFLLWIGMACVTTGFILVVFPMGNIGVSVIFSISSLFFLAMGIARYKKFAIVKTTSDLNNHEARLIGQIFLLDQPLNVAHSTESYKGCVVLNDVRWMIQSAHDIEISAGTRVRVTGLSDNTLCVVPVTK